MRLNIFTLSIFFFIAVIGPLHADEKEDLTVLRNTVVNLLQTLVDQGVMSQEQARGLVDQAQQKAEQEIADKQIEETVPESVVRVPYIPEIVKEEIRNQVRNELKAEVLADVVSHAEKERWGVKDALPGWLNRIKLSGDIRVRGQGDIYDSANRETGGAGGNPYINVQAINDAGPFTQAEQSQLLSNDRGASGNLITDEDRYRERLRLRLNLDAKINETFSSRVRLTTGNTSNPVSTNQTLGQGGNRYDVVLDQAFIKFDGADSGPVPWLSFSAGRIANPWMSTDLLWDDDLAFDGVAGTATFGVGESDGLYALEHNDKEVFVTMGLFPLEEFGRSSSYDKWLYGAQVGTEWNFSNQSKFKIAAAYYDFINVRAKPDPKDVDEFLASIPNNVQKGNTTYLVQNPFDEDPLTFGDETFLYGLASDYNIFNLTASYDYAKFAPYHLVLTADYIKNIGYSSSDVDEAVGEDISEKSEGYHLRFDFGWPKINRFGDWNVFGAYKHLERDATIDAFTDSNFRLGGTDSEGWELGGNVGLARNVWLSLVWRTANEIDGPVVNADPNCDVNNCNLGIDVIQLDLNARY